MSERRRTRRFLQFSLRALLVFVLLVSVGMSWFAVKLERARRQKEAVEAIEKAGGEVGYDYDLARFENPSAEPFVPEWVRAICVDDFFYDVVWVHVYFECFGDDEAIYLKGLTDVTRLEVIDTEITDAGLKHLEGLSSLTHLDLSQNEITDAGLEHLEGLSNLEWLHLGYTHITDAGLEHLQGLTNLELLDLCDTQVTDHGLERLNSLGALYLGHTHITDAGLKHLEGMSSLKSLYLKSTQVTPEGVKKLQEALPDCEIVY